MPAQMILESANGAAPAGLLAEANILADAGTAVAIAISLVLVIALAVLYVRLQSLVARMQALSAEIAEFRRDARKPAQPAVVTPPPAPVATPAVTPAPVIEKPVAPVPTGPSGPELVAIITAAAMAILGRRVAVRRITFINQNTVSGWAEAGRLSIHTSHNVRRN